MLEDPPLQLARRGARRQAELEQSRGEIAVGAERVDLAAGGVEREHQRADELLAQRVRGRQSPQLVDRLARPAELDQRACAGFLGLAAQVLEPPHLGPRELGVGEVAERRAAPERQRAVEQFQRGGGGQRGRLAQAALEALRVDLLGRDLEPVAGAVANEQRGRGAAIAAGLEERAQVGHPHGQRARGDLARHALPRRLEQRVRRNGAAGGEQQAREDRALLRSGRRRAGRRPGDLDRPQHAELHAPDLTPAGGGRKRAVEVP